MIILLPNWQKVLVIICFSLLATDGYSGADLKYLIRYVILHSIDFNTQTTEMERVKFIHENYKSDSCSSQNIERSPFPY